MRSYSLAAFTLLLLCLLTMSVPIPSYGSEIEDWCETQWIQESGRVLSKSPPDFGAMLERWRLLAPRCQSTLTYSGRLALIQIFHRDFADAKATLDKVNPGKSPYGYVIEAARIQLDVQERLADSRNLTKAELIHFEARYIDLVKKYPHWPIGYGLLGGTETLLGKHREAIKNLEKSLNGKGYELSGVYRNLAISRAAVGDFGKALDAADTAYELDKNLTSDPQFVYATVNSSTALGYLEDAENMLNVIAAKRPDVRNDPEFLSALDSFRRQRARQTVGR